MLGVFAEFETNLSRERLLEGIAKARRPPGVYKGRRALIEVSRVRKLKAGMRPTEIARGAQG
jgi:DNA invertase Pin-like site-specific DNA recombinase